MIKIKYNLMDVLIVYQNAKIVIFVKLEYAINVSMVIILTQIRYVK